MQVAIVGGNGMLGYDLRMLLLSFNYKVTIYDLPEYDITRPGVLALIVDSADVIVNCAAYTAVDKAESEQRKCYKINTTCVGELGFLAAKKRKYLLHISTDFVFGDYAYQPLKEDSRVNPLGVYGKSKLEGELLLYKTGEFFSILRIQWTYGINGENFVSKIIKTAKTNSILRIVDDQVGSPTPTIAVANAIIALVREKQEGTFHFASDGYASRFEVAKFIFEKIGVTKSVIPCKSEEFFTPAKRPKNSRFDCSKIDKILPFKRLSWQTYLQEFLHSYSSRYIQG